MSHHTRFVVLGCAAVAVMACNSPASFDDDKREIADLEQEEPQQTLRVETKDTVFVGTQNSAIIEFTVTNHGPTAVYIARCDTLMRVGVDRKVGNEWVGYMSAMCQTHLPMRPLLLGVGEHRTAKSLAGSAGRYRLRLGTSMNSGDELEWVASNEFVVK